MVNEIENGVLNAPHIESHALIKCLVDTYYSRMNEKSRSQFTLFGTKIKVIGSPSLKPKLVLSRLLFNNLTYPNTKANSLSLERNQSLQWPYRGAKLILLTRSYGRTTPPLLTHC